MECKNWILYSKEFDSFHSSISLWKSWARSTFIQFFSFVITKFTLTCTISTRFLKNIKKWKYYREEKQDFERFLILKCRKKQIKLNSVRTL